VYQVGKETEVSNIDILEKFQSKVLRIITDAPWYVPSAVIKHDLQVPSVRQEVRTYSVTYHARSADLQCHLPRKKCGPTVSPTTQEVRTYSVTYHTRSADIQCHLPHKKCGDTVSPTTQEVRTYSVTYHTRSADIECHLPHTKC